MSEHKPMTLEDLRQMNGKPVQYEATGEVFIVDLDNPDFGECLVNADGYYIPLHRAVDRAFGRRFFAYERPRIDRSAWEPCAECRSCDNCENSSDYDPDEGIYGECGRCHEYSNFEPCNFCRECGRPLTDAAWDMLEKRLEGAK